MGQPKDIVFRPGSASEAIEAIMKPDSQGRTDWFDLDDLARQLPKEHANKLRGNGSSLFQSDRGLGRKYHISDEGKEYGERNKLQFIRFLGWATGQQQARSAQVPAGVRQVLLVDRKWCSVCGSGSKLEVDHKDGRKDTSNDLDDRDVREFQLLCPHCNKVKRGKCKACQKTGQRYDGRRHGFARGWVVGKKAYEPATVGCRGCYWHDPINFVRLSTK